MSRVLRLSGSTAPWLLVVQLAGLALGCDRDVTLGGQVLTNAGEPLEGAEISVTCPEVCVSALTDATGRFFSSKPGACAVDCSVAVRRSGYQPFTAEVSRLCVPPGGGAGKCRKVWVEARLVPVPTGS